MGQSEPEIQLNIIYIISSPLQYIFLEIKGV